MDLKCKKLDCVFNKDFCCVAKNIDVGENLKCKKFKHNYNLNEKQIQNVSKTMFEVAPEYHPYRLKSNVKICCEAKKCLFNQNGNCCSNGITIQRDNFGAYCSTSIKDKK